MPAMPSMPEINMPSMPSMDSPYYKPKLPDYSSKAKVPQTSTTVTTPATNQNQNNKTTSVTNPTVNTKIKNSNTLSALDVTSLYEAGLFDDLSTLTGNSTNNASISTNILLQQILTSLEDLKNQQAVSSDQDKNALNETQKDSMNFKQREPQVLRFKINGYVIADSLKTVFFSNPEADGSFLLTADRVYYLNQQERNETIYLLFKVKKHNGSTTVFSVEPTLLQDKLNQNSFLYKLCQQTEIEAQKTGNLVSVHCNKEDFSMDLLLDIDK